MSFLNALLSYRDRDNKRRTIGDRRLQALQCVVILGLHLRALLQVRLNGAFNIDGTTERNDRLIEILR